ncbi:MAG: transcriptional regulator NrdR [Thermodesulfobacteriota bacterium]
MKCPYCGCQDDKVIDSRPGKGGEAIRRRRECLACQKRFTTYEIVEQPELIIVKKDGRREPFSADKIRNGMLKACEKRNISVHAVDEFIEQLEQELRDSGEKEIPASVVGERIMARLKQLDDVAYVRFASVYREFKHVNDFMDELATMLQTKKQ